jgi:murein DD-endopeptidase MepM/ murein hydrolase activator NlpD/muramidase (phage lysozyme)
MSRDYYENLLKNDNIRAMLNVIASCEGATYNTIVTYKKLYSYADHPRQYQRSVNSDAAGRYQFISTTWDSYKRFAGATDFSPHNQDLVAIVLIHRKQFALKEVLSGNIEAAMNKLSHEWASLPPWRYSKQGVCTLSDVKKKFAAFKGKRLGDGAVALGDTINPNSPTNSPVAGTAPQLPSGEGALSIMLTGSNCDPPPYTVADRIIYTGCATKIATARPGGTGYPYPAPGMGVLGTGAPAGIGAPPVNFTPIPGGFIRPCKGIFNSPFGWRWGRMHNGVDIANNTGTPILASGDGKVIYTGPAGGYGNIVDIQHANGLTTRYAHLSKIIARTGQDVKQGIVIGLMGSTGFSTGPHLHFEVRRGGSYGKPLNPVLYVKI